MAASGMTEITRWVRFEHQGQAGFGRLDGEGVAVHTGDLFDAPIVPDSFRCRPMGWYTSTGLPGT